MARRDELPGLLVDRDLVVRGVPDPGPYISRAAIGGDDLRGAADANRLPALMRAEGRTIHNRDLRIASRRHREISGVGRSQHRPLREADGDHRGREQEGDDGEDETHGFSSLSKIGQPRISTPTWELATPRGSGGIRNKLGGHHGKAA